MATLVDVPKLSKYGIKRVNVIVETESHFPVVVRAENAQKNVWYGGGATVEDALDDLFKQMEILYANTGN